MKQLSYLLLFLFYTNLVVAQKWVIEQSSISDNKTHRIKVGDKVLISFKQLNSESISRPSAVFVNSTDTGYTRTVLKARITGINENTLEIKDLSVRDNRTILIDKIDGIRRLSMGKQILRATSQIVGYTTFGMGFAYVHENLWTALCFWAGGSTFLALSSEDFHTKYETKWRYKVVPQ
ncbi:hypothetical protein [Sediminibacterium sp.]|uniref:hypothetical protein n=1 Tax=Sediminibacterium sp. TaxID=1917865 RepID=UPI003F6EC21C